MLTFPANLIPNYVKIDRLPAHVIGLMVPQFDVQIDTVQLSGQPLSARLTLQYRSLSVNIPTRTDCHQQERAGWSAMYAFYQLTESGVLEFDIPATHPVWKVSPQSFMGYLWRIVNITQTGNVVGDFDVTIQQSRSRQKTLLNQVSLAKFDGVATQDISVQKAGIPLATQESNASVASGVAATNDINSSVANWVDLDSQFTTVQIPKATDTSVQELLDIASYSEPVEQPITPIPVYNDFDNSMGYEFNYTLPVWYDIQN